MEIGAGEDSHLEAVHEGHWDSLCGWTSSPSRRSASPQTDQGLGGQLIEKQADSTIRKSDGGKVICRPLPGDALLYRAVGVARVAGGPVLRAVIALLAAGQGNLNP